MILAATIIETQTVAKLAEKRRRRDLGDGFNGVEEKREERIRTVRELGRAYLDDYKLRHKSIVFAEYALGNVVRHLGAMMAVDVTDQIVTGYYPSKIPAGAEDGHVVHALREPE